VEAQRSLTAAGRKGKRLARLSIVQRPCAAAVVLEIGHRVSDVGGVSDGSDLADEVPASRASRRKQHSAGVHRRRRVVFAILGVIVLVVVAVVVWYEVESSGSGTGEPRSCRSTRARASVVWPLRCRQGSDRQHIGLPSVRPAQWQPDGDAGHVLFHQNSSFSEVHATLNGGSMSAP